MGDPGEWLGGLTAFIVMSGIGFLGIELLTKNHRDTAKLQWWMFFIAFLLRFATASAIYQVQAASSLGDLDSIGWGFGITLYKQWIREGNTLFEIASQWGTAFHGDHIGYYYLLGTYFMVIGVASRMAAATLNCFFGAVTVVVAYRTARTLFSERVAIRVGWWSCLFPSMIIWSSQTIKEPVVIMLECIALYGALQLKKSGFSFRHVMLAGLAVVFLLPFRFYAAYIAMGAIGIAFVTSHTGNRAGNPMKTAFGTVAMIFVLIVAAGVLAGGESRVSQFDIDFIEKFRHDVSTGAGSGSGDALNVDMHTTTGFGLATAYGALNLLFAPLPWQLGGASVRMLATTPELFYWYWLFFVGVIPGLIWSLKNRFLDIQPVLFFICGLGLLYSMMFANVGLVFRERAQLLPWLFIFGGVGLELRQRKGFVDLLPAESKRRGLPLPAPSTPRQTAPTPARAPRRA